ncbi:hypothetical protein P5V90_21740 [Mycobacteroides abscessus subsp. abscessus]|uniref:hypothetical protein n=1 Tax=Mycobacteroides abscessus TaxID=36809 RepID=UPI000A432F1D|nr:hypothetical protein [Mycobacteroides abscessus]MDO3169604.1 hypothetical protein [Mycobacteroides abscessus subsp. abscessus]
MDGSRSTVRVAGSRLEDRVLVMTTSHLPTGLDEILATHSGISGVVAAGGPAVRECRKLKGVQPGMILGQDTQAARSHWATVIAPFHLPAAGLFGVPSLSDQVMSAGSDVDAVIAPSGTVRHGDTAALRAVVAGSNAVSDPRLVCSLPVEAGWLTYPDRRELIEQVQVSEHMVALTVVGQFDPLEGAGVAEGLLAVAELCGNKVILHHTDMAALQFIGHGGSGAVIGCTASLRHSVPALRRSRRRRKNSSPGMAVFVPGIDEFRDVTELGRWWGDNAPICEQSGCCGRALTDFDPKDPDDTALLAAHNLRGPLAVAAELLAAADRRSWLRDYRRQLLTSYDELRKATRAPGIVPYGSANIWLHLDN